MSSIFEQRLQQYAELALKVGLNLQPGQRLLVRGPYSNPGVSIQAAPLVRQVVASAYRMGARRVDVVWHDDQVLLSRLQHAPLDSIEEYPEWLAKGMLEYVERGDAMLAILAEDPGLLDKQDPDRVARLQKAARQNLRPISECVSRNAINWLGLAAAIPGWAARVFPDVPAGAQPDRLWQALFEICRLDRPDPLAAWQDHLSQLEARHVLLSARQYTALKLTGPGTDLTIGLPKGHIWRGGSVQSETGITFVPNLPTEEVFTLPDKDRAEGVVRATKPLSYGGALIEDFSLTFQGGRVVQAGARKGESILRKMLESDEGAGRLGEIALVPHSSPISQSGLLFYNTLLDENAASHLALGRAYRFTLQGGEALSPDGFAQAGGNHSLLHVDFMIGSGEIDVDGQREDGAIEPVMRQGEWAFEV